MMTRKNTFSTNETAFAVDRTGQIVAWNHAAERTFNYTESDALDQRCWELLSGRDVFGNRCCCEGCPILVAAFNNEPVKRFQIDFETAEYESNRFTVTTLMLFDERWGKAMVHLCHPREEATKNKVVGHAKIPRAPNKPSGPLTARETEVLALLHKGRVITEIATVMGISVSTVRNHIQHILSKLHVHTRLDAVVLGRKLGLI